MGDTPWLIRPVIFKLLEKLNLNFPQVITTGEKLLGKVLFAYGEKQMVAEASVLHVEGEAPWVNVA